MRITELQKTGIEYAQRLFGRKEKNMTLKDLQKVLGERIELINDVAMGEEERKKEMEKTDMIARVAKQMINNADVILRTDKLIAEGKLKDSTIEQVVGK